MPRFFVETTFYVDAETEEAATSKIRNQLAFGVVPDYWEVTWVDESPEQQYVWEVQKSG